MNNFSRRAAWILFWVTQFAAIIFAISLNLTDEEAYYWSWSKIPALSYFDHPPIQAWVTNLLTFLFGDHAWVVRLPALFGHAITLVLIFFLARKIYDETVAWLAVIFSMGTLLLLIGSTIAIPDAFATPLCLLAIYFTEDDKPKSAALSIGLAVLAKWTSLFITPILLYRFWKKGLSAFKLIFQIILIPIFVQLPVVIWNIQHKFVTLKFHLEDRQAHAAFSLMDYFKNFSDFLGAQIFSIGLTGLALLIFAFIAWKNSYKNISFDQKEKNKNTLLWTLPGFLVVALSGIHGQDRFYWTNISLLMLEIFLIAYVIEKKPEWENKMAKWGASLVSFTWVALFLAVLIPFGAITAKITHNENLNAPSLKAGLLLWPTWFEKNFSEQDRNDQGLAIVTSDLHSASQIAWNLGAKNILRIQLGQNRHQFGIWQDDFKRKFTKALFLADFRHEDKYMFKRMCADKLDWHTNEVIIDNIKVGEIFWARCNHYSYL